MEKSLFAVPGVFSVFRISGGEIHQKLSTAQALPEPFTKWKGGNCRVMQAELGKKIVPDSTYSNIEPGDLIFFGSPERVSHVGICLGGSYFIHCSDDVHINSLDESDPLFNAYRKRTFRFIKRL